MIGCVFAHDADILCERNIICWNNEIYYLHSHVSLRQRSPHVLTRGTRPNRREACALEMQAPESVRGAYTARIASGFNPRKASDTICKCAEGMDFKNEDTNVRAQHIGPCRHPSRTRRA